jgi:hypothetical protein
MALRDPVAVYNAATNLEAHHLCNLLDEAGIQAFLTEDLSLVGTWVGGLVPEMHKPQVWVERTDVERATLILQDYEQRAKERRTKPDDVDGPTIDAVCENCGARSSFPSVQRGSVQDCPLCGAFIDVGEEEWTEEDREEEAADES